MNASTHDKSERLSRRGAAEQLIDVAYALTAGRELRVNGNERVPAPLTDEVILRRKNSATNDRVELHLELSWSTAKPAP